MRPVKFGKIPENVPIMLQKIVICLFICGAVDGVFQNQTNGRRGKFCSLLGSIFLVDFLARSQNGAIFSEHTVYLLNKCLFVRNTDQEANCAFALTAACRNSFRMKARRCGAAQPAAILRQFHQVILDALRQNIAFKLCDDSKHLNDNLGRAVHCIDIVGTNQQSHIMPLEIFQQPHQIRSLSADTIQLIAGHSLDFSHLNITKHSLKIGTI